MNFISSKIILQKCRQYNDIFRQKSEMSPPAVPSEQKYLGNSSDRSKIIPDRIMEIQVVI